MATIIVNMKKDISHLCAIRQKKKKKEVHVSEFQEQLFF